VINSHLLSSLKPLPKLHLSWPFQASGDTTIPMWQDQTLLKDYVRITGSLPLSLEWYTADQLDIAARLAAPICLSTTPYRRMAAKKLAADDIGPDFLADLADFTGRLAGLSAVAARISHVVIDIEHWRGAGQPEEALVEKHQRLSRELKVFLPRAAQIFYQRGAIQPDASSDDGWRAVDYYPPASPGDFNSCSLYYGEWSLDQQIWLRTSGNSPARPVAAFLSLGGFQTRQGTSWGPFVAGGWSADTAWQIGLEINHPWAASRPGRFPLSGVPLVVFWPAAFDPKYPAWGDQFIAYCRGAANEPLRQVT
jgi:hypothetical protein